MLRIRHGEPNSTGFWLIAYPHVGDPMFDKVSIQDKELKKAVLEDPKSGTEITVEIHDMFRFDSSQGIGDAFSKLSYGINGKKLMSHLFNRYPHWDGQLVEFLLVKKV